MFEEKNLMLKFLQRNYPTHRLKTKMGFKRSIILDGQIYRLSDKTDQNNVFYALVDKIKYVFYSDGDLIQNVVKNFLNMK